MKKQKSVIYAKLIIIILITIEYLYPNIALSEKSVVYFLLDKSNSMWAQEPNTKKPVFFIARKQIYDIISNMSFKYTRAVIILFDSRLKKSYRSEIDSIEKAKLFLKNIIPGGGTTIGDRLDEIRLEIKNDKIKNVEVHLFSDLIEEHPGKVSFETAVKQLNNMLKNGKRDKIKWKLFAYTWETKWDKVTPNEIKQKLDLPNVSTMSLNEKQKIIYLEPPDAVFINLIEEKGRIIGVKQGQMAISGLIDPALLNHNVTIKILPYLNKANVNVSVLLNGNKELWVTRRDIENNGHFTIKDIKLSFKNIVPYLNSLEPSVLSGSHILQLTSELYPKEITKKKIATPPKEISTSIFFTSSPVLFCVNYPPGTSLSIKNVPEGEPVHQAIELRWNVGAVDKLLECETVIPDCFFTDQSNMIIKTVILDDTMKKTIFFHLNHAKSVSNSNISLSIRDTSIKISIPVSIEVIKPSVFVSTSKKSIILPISNKPMEIDEFVLFDMNLTGHSFELELLLSTCKGVGCENLNFSMYNPLNPGMALKPGEPPLKTSLSTSLWFNVKTKASLVGKKRIQLICHSKKRQIDNNGELVDKLSIPIEIDCVKPKLTWEIIHRKKPRKLGTTPKKFLKFVSKGQDVSTTDKDLEKYQYFVNVKLYPDCDFIKSTEIKLSNESLLSKDKQFVKNVFFNINKTPKCTIEELLTTPHITLQIDSSKKPFLGTKKERGKILFKLVDSSSENYFDMPIFYYGVDLKP